MRKTATVKVYHDTRKQSKYNEYPVQLKVYYNKVTRFYPVYYGSERIRITPEVFKEAYTNQRVKPNFKNLNTAIVNARDKAIKVINDLEYFTFNDFTKGYAGSVENHDDLIKHFAEYIEYGKTKRTLAVKTQRIYSNAINSIINYFAYVNRVEIKEIPFKSITPEILAGYEKYMLDVEIVKDGKCIKKKSTPTTVSMYTRCVRAVYNDAIDAGYITDNINPFGRSRRKYSPPPNKGKRKIFLNKDQLTSLITYDAKGNQYLQKARDFFLFSLAAQGINFKDICLLKYQNIDGDTFTFYRAKTENKRGGNIEPITVPITEYIQYVFDVYGNKDNRPENYIFPTLNNCTSEEDIAKAIDNFIRSVNQQLKKLVEPLNLPASFSTYYARHTYISTLYNAGVSFEEIKRSVGHSRMSTTEGYIHSFKGSSLKEINTTLVPLVPPDKKAR